MRLRDALAKLPGSDAQIEIVPERTHMDLYAARMAASTRASTAR